MRREPRDVWASPENPMSVSSYKQALAWIWQYVPFVEITTFIEGGDLTPTLRLVCDVFWVTPKRLRADLDATLNEVSNVSARNCGFSARRHSRT